MQNRLSQDLIALKGFEASLIKESGADRTPAKAGSGVLSETQPHDAIKGRCIRWSERQRKKNLFSPLLVYFVAPEIKPRASHTPGKILIYQ